MSKHTDTSPERGIKKPEFSEDIPADSSTNIGAFVYEHYVAWGECDPAQIAYTANIPKWGLLAVEHWYRTVLGYDWYMLNLEFGIGPPFVSLNFDFVAPVKPPEPLEIIVTVAGTGNSSITHHIEGYQEKKLCFKGDTVAVFVNATTMKSISIPSNIKKCIEQFVLGQINEHSNKR